MFVLLPLSAGAHAFGVSHETITPEGVRLDVGYSSAAPMEGESVIFDFNLPPEEADKEYTDVWVRVESSEGSVVLATAVHNAEFGGPRMSYVFPREGTYTISVRYEKEGDAIAKSAWDIVVVPSAQQGMSFLPLIYGLLGLFLGALGMRVVPRVKKLLGR
jgi:hypothetical protein